MALGLMSIDRLNHSEISTGHFILLSGEKGLPGSHTVHHLGLVNDSWLTLNVVINQVGETSRVMPVFPKKTGRPA